MLKTEYFPGHPTFKLNCCRARIRFAEINLMQFNIPAKPYANYKAQIGYESIPQLPVNVGRWTTFGECSIFILNFIGFEETTVSLVKTT